MKQVMKIILIGSALLFMAYSTPSYAQDVYNFYFQKGAAPGSIMQGGSGAPAAATLPGLDTAAPAGGANPAATTTASSLAKDLASEFKPRWAVSVGTWSGTPSCRSVGDYSTDSSGVTVSGNYGMECDQLGGAYIGGQYIFNQHVAAEANLYHVNGIDKVNVGAGVIITPFRINLFGHDFVDVSIHGGARSLTYSTSSNEVAVYGPDVNSYEPTFVDKQKTGMAFYYGVGLNLNLTKDFSLDLKSNAFSVKGDTSSETPVGGSFGLTWKI